MDRTEPSRFMEIRSQKKVSNACSHCKHRKRKCSSVLPCEACVAHNIKCVFDGTTDGRRRENIHRDRVDYALHKRLLNGLWERLTGGDDHIMRALIERKASIPDLAFHLLGVSSWPGNHEIPLETETNDTRKRRKSNQYDYSPSLRSSPTNSSTQQIPYPTPDYVEIFGNLSFSTAMPDAGYSATMQDYQFSNFRLPLYMVQSLNSPSEHMPVTTLYTKFRDHSRRAIASGVPEEVVLGSKDVNIDLVSKSKFEDVPVTPLIWICQLQQRFDCFDLYVRLCSLYFVSRYLRWTISPTAENFDLLPECMRPSLCQRSVPHPAIMDLWPIPALRDVFIQQYYGAHLAEDEHEKIVDVQLAGMRTNWTGSWDEAVVFDPQLRYRTLSQQFIKTVSRTWEWTCGRSLLEKFPQLKHEMQFANESSLSINDKHIHEAVRDRS